ncbi:MAG: NAD(+) diphosphatase [Gammaproteobacteria bacterium]|uniref:NAD(+) diphosphatase n=1 Tax=Pseudomaricurvus alcaniphilus TaxID=1166482 RepID=UPI00140AC42E|nr:NAD(+) diphosphatase [Pseudomaricurvus alcaniphilus]MBR9911941.1 NAD(+) diphosphatase [Gammaproteobacteria bacterium]NHN36008.1 NAD(+) diphosphatase [Pseudomaricurvus alcaniphilus]
MFIPDHKPLSEAGDSCFIAVSQGQILAPDQSSWAPLEESTWRFSNPQLQAPQYCIGRYRGADCFVVLIDDRPDVYGHHWIDLRRLMALLDEAHYQMAARALQVIQWKLDHRFCGRCGAKTVSHRREMASHCDACDLFFYPRLSPCVIVLITRGDHCLLARNANFAGPFFSALAGFIEAGETIEGALQREVMEEVGIEVGQLKYFGSQSWPFPSQLMIGFHAAYAGGDIEVDGEEIVEADWFRYDELPQVPPETSLAGQLIRHFVAQHNNIG